MLKKYIIPMAWISIDKDGYEIIIFSGDLRYQLQEILTKYNIVNKDLINIHSG